VIARWCLASTRPFGYRRLNNLRLRRDEHDTGKKVTATICLETPAFGRGRVGGGDRQMVAVTIFPLAAAGEEPKGLPLPMEPALLAHEARMAE
jgi:hypothetical protein